MYKRIVTAIAAALIAAALLLSLGSFGPFANTGHTVAQAD